MRLRVLSLLLWILQQGSSFTVHHHHHHYSTSNPSKVCLESSASTSLDGIASDVQTAFDTCKSDISKTCKVRIGTTTNADNRLGLIATTNIKKGDVILSMPYDNRLSFTASIAREEVFKGILSDSFEGWTGDAGLIALLLLNEVAAVSTGGSSGVAKPKRPEPIQTFIEQWITALPSPSEMKNQHPILWSEEDQEILQSSSTTKIYQVLDDIEEDATWLVENIFKKDRTKFPERVKWRSNESGKEEEIDCFSVEGYKWAMALTQSRSIFLDGCLRLIPVLDMCNHDDDGEEINGGTMGTFGTTKGALLTAGQDYKTGEEVFCSYGPKSAADYLLEHGFCPPKCWKTAVSEITLEVNPEDRFYDDKLDILEFETYDQAPLDPSQSFDLVSAPGRDGEPDPAMIQFARLCQLGDTDAFLLEALFRKEVWEFMSMPVSEKNELKVIESITEVCESSLNEFNQCPTTTKQNDENKEICTKLRESETKAVKRTLEFLLREKEALDLKEYYQERRLKDLGLDSEWSPEDDGISSPDDDGLSFGQTRLPGGADYDW